MDKGVVGTSMNTDTDRRKRRQTGDRGRPRARGSFDGQESKEREMRTRMSRPTAR